MHGCGADCAATRHAALDDRKNGGRGGPDALGTPPFPPGCNGDRDRTEHRARAAHAVAPPAAGGSGAGAAPSRAPPHTSRALRRHGAHPAPLPRTSGPVRGTHPRARARKGCASWPVRRHASRAAVRARQRSEHDSGLDGGGLDGDRSELPATRSEQHPAHSDDHRAHPAPLPRTSGPARGTHPRARARKDCANWPVRRHASRAAVRARQRSERGGGPDGGGPDGGVGPMAAVGAPGNSVRRPVHLARNSRQVTSTTRTALTASAPTHSRGRGTRNPLPRHHTGESRQVYPAHEQPPVRRPRPEQHPAHSDNHRAHPAPLPRTSGPVRGTHPRARARKGCANWPVRRHASLRRSDRGGDPTAAIRLRRSDCGDPTAAIRVRRSEYGDPTAAV